MRVIYINVRLIFSITSCTNDDKINTDPINVPGTASITSSDASYPTIEFDILEFDFGVIAAGKEYLKCSHLQILDLHHS